MRHDLKKVRAFTRRKDLRVLYARLSQGVPLHYQFLYRIYRTRLYHYSIKWVGQYPRLQR
ncbi:MAG TPA: hypothetical protein VN038_01460 [Dyadobacter sp.]|nr:hypothetical protein [Dyadobacter sp.]